MNRFVALAGMFLTLACKHEPEVKANLSSLAEKSKALNWTTSPLILPIAPSSLNMLPGQLAGSPIYISNNPEIFQGPGWLMQNSHESDARGGKPNALDGEFLVYLFHVNKSGSNKFIHVVASNPNSEVLSIEASGAIYTNSDKPLDVVAGNLGQSYAVAEDWVTSKTKVLLEKSEVDSNQFTQIAKINVKQLNMVDGRILVKSTGKTFIYVVATQTGELGELSRYLKSPSKGQVYEENIDRYGREAGIFPHSSWKGEAQVDLPQGQGWLAFPIGSSAKFAIQGVKLQDQTSLASYKLYDSSSRSYGNFGFEYKIHLKITNPVARPRLLKIYMAHRIVESESKLSFTFNGPITIDGELIPTLLTPQKSSQLMKEIEISEQGNRELDINLYIPGLITEGTQLVLSLDD